MSFLTLAALAVAFLVGAPIAAHMLRRRQAEERAFPPARLVPATPPVARRRSLLEDRVLFGLRALAVLALAILGATPLLRCSRLALARQGGASVALAIVIDDSLSMRAPLDGGQARSGATTRFDRALEAAQELTDGVHPGDSIAIVLAGAPPRVALAPTTNMAAVTAALEGIEPSDRATDIDGATRLARELLKGLAQVDKRVVLLSDLADGNPETPIGSEGDIQTWVPLPELEARGSDCAVTRADRVGARVIARVVCAPPSVIAAEKPEGTAAPAGSSPDNPPARVGDPAAPVKAEGLAPGRSLEVRAGERVIASIKGTGSRIDDLAVDLPADAPPDLHAGLTGVDAIAEDDETPVISAGGSLSIAVVVDIAMTHVETGGPPPIEQAFAAMDLDARIRPLPAVPEHADELNAYAALVVDDPPGFTPEVRRSLAAWVERGGVVLLTLGPRAAAAPLGAGFEPLVPGVVRWGPSPATGVDPASAPSFGPSAEGLTKLAPQGRTQLEVGASEGADVLARWTDGAPFLLRRPIGRGAVLALTLPLSTEESDLALRPAFLALLDRLVNTARARGGARRIEVGETWTFDGFKEVSVRRLPLTRGVGLGGLAGSRDGVAKTIPTTEAEGRLRVTAPLAGLYELTLDGEPTTRVASVAEREIDLRPRAVLPTARSTAMGGVASSIDASPFVALALLALLAAELAVRVLAQRATRRSVLPTG